MALEAKVDCPDLSFLAGHIGDCHRCPLGDTRTCLVFGVGDPNAELMFIGEAPGKNEDLKGEPFVGAAGRFLDELLASIGLNRSQVYIANVLKCRPPSNRDPLSEEIATCTPFLAQQVRLIEPKVIATLGNFATRWLLDTTAGITTLRGKLYHVEGRQVVPIFHPAVALYDPRKRGDLFDDFKRLRAVIDRTGMTPEDGGANVPSASREAASPVGESLAMSTHGEARTAEAGRALAALLAPDDVLSLSGDLGAGKTCLVQGIAAGLGITGHVASPTFNILLVHRGRLTLNHMDLYRLDRADQLEDIDFFATLESGGVTAIEWGDKFPASMPEDRLEIAIRRGEGDDDRVIELDGTGARSAALARAWADSFAGLGGDGA